MLLATQLADLPAWKVVEEEETKNHISGQVRGRDLTQHITLYMRSHLTKGLMHRIAGGSPLLSNI